MWRRLSVSSLASLLYLTTLSCHRADVARTVVDDAALPHQQVTQAVAPVKPLILSVNEGERRRRRFAVSAPDFILKVDPQNGGSTDITMGYEDVPPGGVIPPHRHKMADEILFIHRGSGVVELGDQEEAFTDGATIFIPKDVRVTVRNTGSGPLSVAFFFSKPGFESFLREMSALEGESFVPLSAQELRAIRKRHEWHTVYDNP